MRIMGLDVGDKTIGVAVSDALKMTAQGLETIRLGEKTDQWRRLQEICGEFEVEKIVVGMPRNMDGSMGKQAEKVQQFIASLKEKIELPVQTWDERLSTLAAQRTLLEGDVSRKKRKRVIDKMAAVFILQGYLDSLGQNFKEGKC